METYSTPNIPIEFKASLQIWKGGFNRLSRYIKKGDYRAELPKQFNHGVTLIFRIAMWKGLSTGKTIVSKSGKSIVFHPENRIDEHAGLGINLPGNLKCFQMSEIDPLDQNEADLVSYLEWLEKYNSLRHFTAAKIKVGKVVVATNNDKDIAFGSHYSAVTFQDGHDNKVASINVPAILIMTQGRKIYLHDHAMVLSAIHTLSLEHWPAMVDSTNVPGGLFPRSRQTP